MVYFLFTMRDCVMAEDSVISTYLIAVIVSTALLKYVNFVILGSVILNWAYQI